MLGKLTRKDEADSTLNFARGDSVSLGVTSKLSSLKESAIKDVSNEGVHDGHGLLGDSTIGVNLLEDLVDVA